jgi:signal-induced proliferation-associated 1 like protein 3
VPLLDEVLSLDGFGLIVEPESVVEPEFIDEPELGAEPEVAPEPEVVPDVEPVVSVVEPAVPDVVPVVPDVVPVLPDVAPGVPEVVPVLLPDVVSDVVPVVPGVEFALLPAVPVLPLSVGVVPVDGLPVLPDEPVLWATATPAAMARTAAAATAPVLNLFMTLTPVECEGCQPGVPGLGPTNRQSPFPTACRGARDAGTPFAGTPASTRIPRGDKHREFHHAVHTRQHPRRIDGAP